MLSELFSQAAELQSTLRIIGLHYDEIRFVWHGGEPLLLPMSFFEMVTSFQKKYIDGAIYRNGVQTNLYSIKSETLDFLLREGFHISVSHDFAPSVRLTATGRESAERVAQNLTALIERGVTPSIVSVLSKANYDSIEQGLDFVAHHNLGWRILPIFEGGPQSSYNDLSLSDEEILSKLLKIWNLKVDRNVNSNIEPIDSYVNFALKKYNGLAVGSENYIRYGFDNVYIINTNGDVFLRSDVYQEDKKLLNLSSGRLTDIVLNESYYRAQTKIFLEKERICGKCDHCGACDTSPMHEYGTVRESNSILSCGIVKPFINSIAKDIFQYL